MEHVAGAGQAAPRKRQRKDNGTAIIAVPGYAVCPAEEMEGALGATVATVAAIATIAAFSPEQLAELRGLIGQSGANEGRFCAYLKIKSIAELEASRFDPACQALRRKLGKVAP